MMTCTKDAASGLLFPRFFLNLSPNDWLVMYFRYSKWQSNRKPTYSEMSVRCVDVSTSAHPPVNIRQAVYTWEFCLLNGSQSLIHFISVVESAWVTARKRSLVRSHKSGNEVRTQCEMWAFAFVLQNCYYSCTVSPVFTWCVARRWAPDHA